MGTPDFAVASLNALVEAGQELVGVVTAPDRPSGRGQKINQSAVKKYAVEKGLRVLQPEKLKAPEFLEELASLEASLFVVVAFRMLPEVVWAMPAKGTFNLHGSLLPQYRGAAPIHWAVMNGETETGVTTFFLDHKIDTGAIIDQVTMPIGADETTGEVHDRMMALGAALVANTAAAVEKGVVTTRPQQLSENEAHAPKIFRQDCQLDWSQSLEVVYNKIRGLSPYPGAWTTLEGKTLKLQQTRKEQKEQSHAAGTLHLEEGVLKIAAAGGNIIVEELQLEGKKRMKADEFARGYDVAGKAVV